MTDTVDLTILQRRVEALMAQVNILSQDVATVRLRLETAVAAVELSNESLRAHVDQGFAGLTLKHDLLRQEMDAGFRAVLEAIGKLHEARHD